MARTKKQSVTSGLVAALKRFANGEVDDGRFLNLECRERRGGKRRKRCQVECRTRHQHEQNRIIPKFTTHHGTYVNIARSRQYRLVS